MIDEPDKARRLVGAICADVALYEGERVRAAPIAERAGILQRPLSEARALYVSRVSPDLHGLFDEEVARLCERLGSGPVSIDTTPAAAHPPLARAEPIGTGSSAAVLALAVALVVATMALAGWFLLRG